MPMLNVRTLASVAAISLLFASSGTGAQPKKIAVRAKFTAFGGFVNGKKVVGSRILKSKDKLTTSKGAMNHAVIQVDPLSTYIRVDPGSTVTMASFLDSDGTTVDYLVLENGGLVYSGIYKGNWSALGPGRRYIVRTKGRAIGAVGTAYRLVSNTGSRQAWIEVTEGKVGVTRPGVYLTPDHVVVTGDPKYYFP
jgi:hypothetical protein